MRQKTLAVIRLIALLLVIAITNVQVFAQLKADFTVDKTGGCSPLTVKFTNTTTGGSGTVTYEWVLGNGNTSPLKDPGATYYTEKTYTVTLTAKSGGQSSTKTMDIAVYKKPTVDFSVTPGKGCVPLVTTFTANATAGDGTIDKYLWDFGDGETLQGSGYQSTNHTYTFPQKPPTSLTVTNSHGCYTTQSKTNMVEAVKGVVASFTASNTNLCKAGDEVSFTNTSSGSGTLTYAWDFGDGKTSSEKEPKHSYGKSGSFVVKLKVSSSDGCSLDATPITLNVANFVADFDVPPIICLNQQAVFTNKSTSGHTQLSWWIDGNNYGSYYSYLQLYQSFAVEGEHTIRLDASYGNCTVSTTKKITVNPVPELRGFVSELQGACGVPVTISFKDTTKTAVKWEWSSWYGNSTWATTQSTSRNFTSGESEYVALAVTNKEGCKSAVAQYVYYGKPNVRIVVKSTTGGSSYYAECAGLTVKLAADPDSIIQTYSWNFADGSAKSTEAEPTHTFTKGGNYNVVLEYTTKSNCKGTATYTIAVVDKPTFDFSVKGSTTICGNTPTTFTATPAATGWTYQWVFNDTYGYMNYGNSVIENQFQHDTTYSVTLIAYNGNCRDTVIKKNYVTVLPPFPKIASANNTCADTRGLVKFTESSKKALQWSWDFGDGSSATTYSSFRDTVPHTYTKTGTYKVVLSATNGACTVKDSVTTYVLLKQKPVLSSGKTETCGSSVLDFKLAGYETNPYPYYNYYSDFYISQREYNDLTPFSSNTQISITNQSYWGYFRNQAEGTISNLDAGYTGLRLISTSGYFNCQDTSNFISVKVKGPLAGFKQLSHSGCFKEPVQFTDTSKVFSNVAITQWQWSFGDGVTQTYNKGGTVSHTYARPGTYYVSLTVTDADGCFNATNSYSTYVQVSGPKADFSASSFNVAPNAVVDLYNTSQDYSSWYYTNSLKWILPDKSTSTQEYNVNYLFTDEGKYDVMLITYNSQTGCTDSITKTITVRKVNSAFTYTLSYINNNSCPPVIARFTSVSSNAARVSWDFGDGGVADNQSIVSHTYNAPGIYRVVHYAYDYMNQVDSTEDFIEIKGPYALLRADTLYACNALQVRLDAEVRYAKEFTWDFGDGTLTQGTDTFATHKYIYPGVYTPALILKDEGGCTATSGLPDKIVIDSMAISFNLLPKNICNEGMAHFTPVVNSLSASVLQTPLKYRWVIKEGTLLSDTSRTEQASHYYRSFGQHPFELQVTSPYGCLVDAAGKMDVRQGVTGSIAGPVQLCPGEQATFKGTAIPASNSLTWHWDFANGQTAQVANPTAQSYTSAGDKNVMMVVSNGDCADTTYARLTIQQAPAIVITSSKPVLCLGDSLKLTASGGSSYEWTPASFIRNAQQATATVWPSANRYYTVKVTNTAGCVAKDSMEVKVISPLTVTVTNPLFACAGNSVQLNASGANSYRWINGTTGLSNAQVNNPTAKPAATTTYTVVGYDAYNCFTDTATVLLRIGDLPTVNAGLDQQVIAGSNVQLTVTGSSNIASWRWLPATYLSCSNCASPISQPKTSTLYELTVATADGCTAKDSVRIELICKSDLVYIPTGFTPNGDNLNDRFAIHGSGVKSIRHFAIYDRWGKTMFERKNVNINDRNSSWDGTLNGQPLAAASFVYVVIVECDGGDLFEYKGTVTLIR